MFFVLLLHDFVMFYIMMIIIYPDTMFTDTVNICNNDLFSDHCYFLCTMCNYNIYLETVL